MIFIDPFWDDEYVHLDYHHEPFNNSNDVTTWLAAGYSGKFTGAMCDMRSRQPTWNTKFVDYFTNLGWQDIGTSYYRMDTGTILPVHTDTYRRYIDLHNLYGRESSVSRAIIFLEDWASGHYLELDGQPIVGWRKGQGVIWSYDTPHMAANIGLRPRYTLQITGHV